MSENNQTKSNGRGGARKGAGRKAGSATTRTREIADKAAAQGLTPLEVMLKAMRHFADLFESSENTDHLGAAATFAKDAAPYIHPRLQAIEHAGEGGGPLTVVVRRLTGA